MVTTRRVRHGIVLTLVGLLAGLGIVAALYGGGGRNRTGEPTAQNPAAALSPDRPAGSRPDGAPATAQEGTRKDPDLDSGNRQAARDGAGATGGDAKPGAADAVQSGAPGRADGAAPKDGANPEAPRFDIVRIEPNGDAVVAGRGKPNTVVEMLVDGKPVARALADPNGQFAIVPPPLPKGSSEIVLRSKTADGQETRSAQSVAVSISPEGKTRPLVALTAPDAPTVVLSQPGASETPPATAEARQGGGDKAAEAGKGPAGAAGGQAARIVSVDAEPGGRLYVTGAGKPGTEVRLYLNDTLIAPGKVGPDGRVTFTIGRGVAQGRYQVRLDEIDPATGHVTHRAEVPFAMPQTVASAASALKAETGTAGAGGHSAEAARKDAAGTAAGQTTPGKPSSGRAGTVAGTPGTGRAGTPPATGGAPSGQAAVSMAAPQPGAEGATDGMRTGAVFVPGIATARIIRGDNLWQISKRTYGRGERYTVIYDANQAQIRDPDLIYPGQIFVLPDDRRG